MMSYTVQFEILLLLRNSPAHFSTTTVLYNDYGLYYNVWPQAVVVVLHVQHCLQTCCLVVIIVVPDYVCSQSFTFIIASVV